MTAAQVILAEQFDAWLKDESDVAALVVRQWLQSVDGRDAVIFPPTYATPEGVKKEDWLGYNLDTLPDGTKVCLIDSVGSQANRMEPIFKRAAYRDLVPQVVIKAGGSEVNLLDAGHRAADAIVRFSDLRSELRDAFNRLKAGDAEPMAKLAPTSLVFGAWDSRETQVKIPRIVRSTIRAFDVRVFHRSAQYVPAIDYVTNGLLDEPASKTDQDRMAELGFTHAPAPWTHGGIQVRGEIRRDAVLNLAALRTLGAGAPERTLALRRYILGLALVSFTAPLETSLREGCQLVPDPDHPSEWQLVRHDGTQEGFSLSHSQALLYARETAARFGVGADRTVAFDAKAAREALAQSKEERRRARRGGGSEQAEERAT